MTMITVTEDKPHKLNFWLLNNRTWTLRWGQHRNSPQLWVIMQQSPSAPMLPGLLCPLAQGLILRVHSMVYGQGGKLSGGRTETQEMARSPNPSDSVSWVEREEFRVILSSRENTWPSPGKIWEPDVGSTLFLRKHQSSYFFPGSQITCNSYWIRTAWKTQSGPGPSECFVHVGVEASWWQWLRKACLGVVLWKVTF